jgi:hypothetical protein
MRRAVSRAMDKYDMRSKKERIISKRGTMKWLPVAGSNDLIHGSWWFVFGSFGVIITSVVIIQNKEKPFWNDDDSTLTPAEFDATWVLMCICGIFSTLGKKEGEILFLFSLAYVSSCFFSFVCYFSLFSFLFRFFVSSYVFFLFLLFCFALLVGFCLVLHLTGSLAFVRAFHENPPMTPMFANYYHLQSDELLASWLFFLATLPFIPYCGIFLGSANFNNLSYLIALILSIVATLGTLLFVRGNLFVLLLVFCVLMVLSFFYAFFRCPVLTVASWIFCLFSASWVIYRSFLACYPSASEKTHKDLLLPISNWLCCCCCSKQWRYDHFMNDWLGGSWCFLWASEISTFGCFVLFAIALGERNTLQIWTYGTS